MSVDVVKSKKTKKLCKETWHFTRFNALESIFNDVLPTPHAQNTRCRIHSDFGCVCGRFFNRKVAKNRREKPPNISAKSVSRRLKKTSRNIPPLRGWSTCGISTV
jgi:hypothetical protein